MSEEYGLGYAKAIEAQWNGSSPDDSALNRRNRDFHRNRKYANGTQDVDIYKKLLNTLDPNSNDGTLLNLDYSPVPVLPKFAKIVANKILSRNLYPNIEAVDPLSTSYKDQEKKKLQALVSSRETLMKLKQAHGIVVNVDPDQIPETLEEAEILIGNNVKLDAEIAAQISTNLTLEWNDFNDTTFRRAVNDLVSCGMCVVKRVNDPSLGIQVKYIDPKDFVHSYTEDPNFADLSYAGSVRRISIHELKRIAGDKLTEEQYKKIAEKSASKNGNDSSKLNRTYYDNQARRTVYGYDEYTVELLEFEFLSTDTMYFEERGNRYGNVGFYMQGYNYKEKTGGVFSRTPHRLDVTNVYGGFYVMGCDYIFDYGMKTNMPRNAYDLSKTNLSFSVVATNLDNMVPKSMIGSVKGFADMLQLTHLKIQQAIAKAKPDGLIIDIEGLENVQLGGGGELQPLDLHDIYEQTGVFYYRSKNPEGGFQNPPIREIGNSIRNINELINLYNHYLRMIRDVTGINEAMDASTPKGDALVGVREQAIAAGNNAIYDITNAALVLFKKVCSDLVKCIQVLPRESIVYQSYANAIGASNMGVMTSFEDLSMFNFGVTVKKDMDDRERQFLEQSIQMSLQQQKIDLEDAMAVRELKDVEQAERLLSLRRQKREAKAMQQAQQNSQMQAQQAQQAAQAASQARQQEIQIQSQLEIQKIQAKAQADVQVAAALHEMKKEIEMIKAQATLGFKTDDQEFKEKIEVLKEDRKDERVDKQAVAQSKLMSQRKDQRGELSESSARNLIRNLTENVGN
ncbi:MAG: hypothetical protein NWE77_06680 [Candidatus Bathyarchaeota archaeon]|nr:hypothetical protein [Candidatus Bathyarchaeota archaeon]